MTPLLLLSGPTAVGKSKCALLVARELSCRIISADSMQIYKGLDIGTAKPSLTEQRTVKHELIDIVAPDESYSSFCFKRDVERIMGEMGNEIPFIVGGTAFYMDSLIYPLEFAYTSESEELRKKLWKFYEDNGADELHNLLERADPISAEKIHKNNVKRVIRALEIAQSGRKMSEGARQKEHDGILFALNLPREALYRRIEQRVDQMMMQGLLDEVRAVYDKYQDKSLQSLQAIGYKELILHLVGELTLDQAVELIKKNSRNYAKRQITYLKRMNPIWLDAEQEEDKLCEIIIKEYRKYSTK